MTKEERSALSFLQMVVLLSDGYPMSTAKEVGGYLWPKRTDGTIALAAHEILSRLQKWGFASSRRISSHKSAPLEWEITETGRAALAT